MPKRDFDSLIRSIQDAAIPIQSIEEDSVRDLIMTADLIWGYDAQRDLMPLFYGKELLEDVSRGREDEFGYQMLLCFTLDLATDEPETLRRAVQELRGSCCYQLGKLGNIE
jgi:hypothetical protein